MTGITDRSAFSRLIGGRVVRPLAKTPGRVADRFGFFSPVIRPGRKREDNEMLETSVGLPLELFDLFGVLGAALYIGNYTLLVMQRLSTDRPVYFSINLLAASLLLLSLTQSFNLGAALIQFFFLVMSVVGIVSRVHPLRQLRRLRRPPVTAPQPIRWSRPGIDCRRP